MTIEIFSRRTATIPYRFTVEGDCYEVIVYTVLNPNYVRTRSTGMGKWISRVEELRHLIKWHSKSVGSAD